MIKTLKRRFIWIATTAYFVLAAMVGISLNSLVAYQFNTTIKDTVTTIIDNGGELPPPDQIPIRREPYQFSILPNTQFLNHYFIIRIADTTTVEYHFIQNMTDEVALSYYESASDSKGYIDYYYYQLVDSETDSYMIFIDVSSLKYSQASFLNISILIASLSTLLVFIVVSLFSSKAIKPIVTSHELQKQFIADLSHELKTPISIIKANVDLIEMDDKPSEWVSSIGRQTDRLNLLINKILELSTLTEQKHIEVSEIDLSMLYQDSFNSIKPALESKGIQYESSIESNITLNGDKDLLFELFMILLDNAIKYSPQEGIIRVTLTKNSRIEFTISNQIELTSKPDLNQLFNRFYKADKARNKANSFGLGLSIAKEISSLHKGTITASFLDQDFIEFKVSI